MKRGNWILLFCFLIIGEAFSQSNQTFFTGLFPEVSITKGISPTQKINFKIENQEIIFDNRDIENPQYSHYRTDIMGFFDQSLRPGISVALGVFHRFQEGEDGNRIIQQLAILQKSRNLRINHRFRTDQTFTRNEPLELRFRYRLSLEIPLQGAELDPGEFYFLGSAESIFSQKGGDFEIENRLVTSLGKFFSRKERMEWGIDYRTDGYIQDGFRTRLWAKISYFYNF
ncbi:uncharacterized protein DUF2490 [Algoriphagus boseongensis]|uniref:Uncharacterized protein DUF2490 n=1 Tax=Algoriphagus boseongensis TaxID=1442587 RepID=A0A4R6T8J9_9BACT|nr:DUF2490 domain-containing protein [Algoriphagus boseongensis]TDQ18549.1 uncharacterized protein DUF2490 [Algoriphagus boseongensis]